MVRADGFQVRLVGPDGEAFPEITHNDKTYVVAAPGSSFEIEATLEQNAPPLPSGTFRSLDLKVDGVGVGYVKFFERPATSSFKGFLKAGDAQQSAYRSFVFAKPEESDAKQATGLNFVEGSIRLEVLHSQWTGALVEGRTLGPADTNTSVAKIPEGKKFFLAPSLTTAAGELKTGSGLNPHKLRYIAGLWPRLSCATRQPPPYCCAACCGEDNPQHHAILQQFPETADEGAAAQQEAGVEPSHAAVAAADSHAASAGTAGGRKRQRQEEERRQQQQQQQQQPRRQRRQQQRWDGEEEEVIDLTKVPAPGDEVLAAQAAHNTLQCDLTGGQAPRWRAVKKEVVEVE